MENRKFKIRQDLIVTAETGRGKTFYTVMNPLSGITARFDAQDYLILRHFNGRSLSEVQRHLEERHNFNVTKEELESYVDLFLDLYLFDRDCLDLYWKKLNNLKKDILAEELKQLAGEWEKAIPPSLPFVEAMILNEAMHRLKNKDVLSAVRYLSDALKINHADTFVEEILETIEKKFVDIGTRPKVFFIAKELRDNALELKPALVLAGILLLGLILSQVLFFNQRPRLAKLRQIDLTIIKIASDTIHRTKLETL